MPALMLRGAIIFAFDFRYAAMMSDAAAADADFALIIAAFAAYYATTPLRHAMLPLPLSFRR